MDEGLYDLLSRGRAAAKAGDVDEARFFLQWVLDRCEGACQERLESLYWMSRISSSPAGKRRWLEEILAVEPFNARARIDLATLDGRLDPAVRIDPDRLPAASPQDVRTLSDDEAQRFTCSRCGGRLTYTPDGQSLICESCDSRQFLTGNPKGSGQPGEEDFLLSMATSRGHLRPVETQSILCEGCGAEFLMPPAVLTGSCPYCGSSYVVNRAEIRELINPTNLIPFVISENEALRFLHAWLTRHDLQPEYSLPRPQGIYLPAWSFTVGGVIHWKGYRNTHKVRKPVSGDEPVTEVDSLIPASGRLKELFQALLKTYTMQEHIPFDPRYLVHWPAKTYEISVGDASLTARALALSRKRVEMKQIQCRGIEDLETNSAGIVVESYQLWLLPVWMAHFSEDDKRYEVMINGQNGSVEGEAPGQNLLEWISGLID